MREAAQKPTSFQKTSIQFVHSTVHSSELYLISFARPLNVSIQISNLIFEIISARHKLFFNKVKRVLHPCSLLGIDVFGIFQVHYHSVQTVVDSIFLCEFLVH